MLTYSCCIYLDDVITDDFNFLNYILFYNLKFPKMKCINLFLNLDLYVLLLQIIKYIPFNVLNN